MEEEVLQKINDQQVKIDKIYKSMEQMRKFFLWMFILSVAFFVIPLIALIFILPPFIDNYLGALSGF